MVVVDVDRVLHREAIGRALAEQHDIGVADDVAIQRRDQMRQAVASQILAPVAQIVRLGRAGIIDTLLDPAADVAAIDRKHRLDVAVAGRADQDAFGSGTFG
jgi:hypothetical protein